MVQKKRRTKSQGKRRASHFALKRANLSKCSHCAQAVMPHQVCDFCGYYRGRQVIEVEAKKLKQLKKEEKAKAKEEKKSASAEGEKKREEKEKGKKGKEGKP